METLTLILTCTCIVYLQFADCMCVYLLCLYTCMCACICAFLCVAVCVSMCLSTCMCICVSISVSVCSFVCLCLNVCVCTFLCLYVCVSEVLIRFEEWAKLARRWLVCAPLGIYLEPINKQLMLLVTIQ